MITIAGLTAKQRALMDIMWSMDTMDKVSAFVKTLPKQDAQDCLSLITIATQESQEEEGALDAYKEAAASVIASVR
jgi:hypothetical protein